MRSAMFPWLIILLYLLSLRETKSDEEDPLQRVAQVAARERQLTEILELLNKAAKKENETIINNDSKSCQHTVLDLKLSNDYLFKFSDGRQTARRLANLLNNFFVNLPPTSANNASEFDYSQAPHLFYALTREALEGELSLLSVSIAFVRGQFYKTTESEKPPKADVFAPFTYRRNSSIYTEDLAAFYNYSYDEGDVAGTQWFTHLLYRVKQRNLNSTKSQWEKSPFVVTNDNDGYWFSRPLLDCGASEEWIVTYSLPFFASNGDGRTAKLRGVVLATFPLRNVDINQCDDSGDILEKNVFGGTHKCDSASTQCIPLPGHGFKRGGYSCRCRASHYLPNEDLQEFNGIQIEQEFALQNDKNYRFSCMVCPDGCAECSGTQICQAQYDTITRLVPVCVQAAAVSICFILIISIFKLRKCKVIAASLWTMLEVILFGAIVIYSTVFLRYVEPTVLMCLLEPWVRELGFALFYGAIVLKLYRTLVDHRTRKAHRYVIRDRDLLRYLSGLLVFMSCYLAAWAAFSGQLALEGHSILDRGRTLLGLNFYACRSFWWDYVTEVGELLFVIFGLYLSWQLRGATRDARDLNELQERRALAAALSLELIFSGTLYVSRHIVWLQAHPDHVFLAYFARTHTTVSISLFLILIPKLWCISGWQRRQTTGRTFSTTDGTQELRLCEAIANGELESANLSQMDPEEIRAELRRVYTQLEELRSRTMRKDNPHISKRRGGRKPTHRRFSLQSRKGSKDKFHSKRNHHHHFDGFDDNKTPEESVCSIEGPSVLSVYADGPSTYSDLGTPSILHRSYKM